MNSLEKFHVYSETIRNNPIKVESTTGSNKIYSVVTQLASDRSRPDTMRDFRYIHCQLRPNCSEVNIAPPPPCKYDTPIYRTATVSVDLLHQYNDRPTQLLPSINIFGFDYNVSTITGLSSGTYSDLESVVHG
jgi:hypothetical protein